MKCGFLRGKRGFCERDKGDENAIRLPTRQIARPFYHKEINRSALVRWRSPRNSSVGNWVTQIVADASLGDGDTVEHCPYLPSLRVCVRDEDFFADDDFIGVKAGVGF